MGSTARIIMEQDTESQRRRKRGRLGCYLQLLIVVAGFVLVFHYLLRPLFESGFGMADTRPVSGDAANFEPFAALPEVADYAGEDAELVEINLWYVRSDGRMDLTAESYNPRAEYVFIRPVAAPADAPPVGAGGSVSGQWYERVTITAYQPGQWRSVTSIGGGVETSYSYMNRGMEREVNSPTPSKPEVIPSPQCSLAAMWEAARQLDAPDDAVATIDYDTRGYHFSISPLRIYVEMDSTCQVKS